MHDVTIIIPVCCNTKESLIWLGNCLRSASKTGAQISCWNDGSALYDYAEQIIGWYATVHGGSRHNKGPAFARNKAVEQCNTRYIFPLDNDDLIREDAIDVMLSHWNGKPIIPDLWKFGTVDNKHHVLYDWSCELQMEILGLASVSVLHERSMWEQIGGWDESLTAADLYEDAEYNFRLFMTYCAENLHIPLFGYRQHQTSRLHSDKRAQHTAFDMLKKLGGYDTMACCGKNKKKTVVVTTSKETMIMSTVNPDEMAETNNDNWVLVQYVGGKGQFKHTSRGPVTKYPHRVVHGQFLYVDPRDAKEAGDAMKSPFVRYHPKSAKTAPAKTKEPVAEKVEEPEKPAPKKTTSSRKKPTTRKASTSKKTTAKAADEEE